MTDHASEFRRFEHAGWERVAALYDKTWAALTRKFHPPILDDGHVIQGTRLLDVACGPGYLAAEATRRGAASIGLDFSRSMLSAAASLHPGLALIEGDSERLPFTSSRFDAVTIGFGLLHMSDPQRALAESRRVLRPGGRVAFSVWARPSESPGRQIVFSAIEQHGIKDVGLPQGPPFFLLSTPDDCRRSLSDAGFDEDTIRFGTHRAAWLVPTAEYLFEAERDAGVRTAGVLAAQPAERLERIRDAVIAGVREHASAGGFSIPMTAHVVSAVAA